MSDPLPNASALAIPPCFVCEQESVQRCEDCSVGKALYLCAQTECFDKLHSKFIASQHRRSLVRWNSAAKQKERCCPTHASRPLDLWCEGCTCLACHLCVQDSHTGHKVSVVDKVWRPMAQELREMAALLKDDAAVCCERLRAMDDPQIESEARAQAAPVVAALNQLEETFTVTMRQLRQSLSDSVVASVEHAKDERSKLVRHADGIVTLLRRANAECADEGLGRAQTVVLEHKGLVTQRAALGDVPVTLKRRCRLAPHPTGLPLTYCMAALNIKQFTDERCGACSAIVAEELVACAGCDTGVCEGCRTRSAASMEELCQWLSEERDRAEGHCLACLVVGVTERGWRLSNGSARLRGERDVVLEAAKHDWMALQHAEKTLAADREFILDAVRVQGLALCCVATKLRADTAVVLEAVQQNGLALQHAVASVRAKRDIVYAAVKQNGRALQFAAEALKIDEELMRAAEKQH